MVITGPSGAGKSSLALQLIAFGAELVADDQTLCTRAPDGILASVPPALQGLIEARGVGLLELPAVPQALVHLVVDLSQTETARLPERHEVAILGVPLPCLHKFDSPHFPAAVLLYLRGSRKEPS